jgi:hypothetical protein
MEGFPKATRSHRKSFLKADLCDFFTTCRGFRKLFFIKLVGFKVLFNEQDMSLRTPAAFDNQAKSKHFHKSAKEKFKSF